MSTSAKFIQIKEKVRKFLVANKEKLAKIKEFSLLILGYGLVLNYTFSVLFHVPFKWYGFPAFGFAYYFISDEFVTWLRRIKAKQVNN